MQTTAHQRFENHVKDGIRSGKPVEYNMSDFQADGKECKKRKQVIKNVIKPEEYKMKSVEEVVSHLNFLYHCMLDQCEKEKLNNSRFSNPSETWNLAQSYMALKCTITGEQYTYRPMP